MVIHSEKKPAVAGFFSEWHPFPPLKSPNNPIQHSEYNDYTEHIENSEYKIVYN